MCKWRSKKKKQSKRKKYARLKQACKNKVGWACCGVQGVQMLWTRVYVGAGAGVFAEL